MPRTMRMPENRTAITPYVVGVGRFVGSRNGSNRFLADPLPAHQDRLLTSYSDFFPAALAFAHLALADSARRLRTAALTLRLRLAVAFGGLAPLCFAHRARCAAAILALAEALILRRLRGAAGPSVLPSSRASFFSSDSILSLTSAARRN